MNQFGFPISVREQEAKYGIVSTKESLQKFAPAGQTTQMMIGATPESNPFFDLELDPKISWALRHIEQFPIEINKASMEELLRIPGVGNVSAMRIVRQRRLSAVKFDDLKKIGVVVKRAKYFMTCCGL